MGENEEVIFIELQKSSTNNLHQFKKKGLSEKLILDNPYFNRNVICVYCLTNRMVSVILLFSRRII